MTNAPLHIQERGKNNIFEGCSVSSQRTFWSPGFVQLCNMKDWIRSTRRLSYVNTIKDWAHASQLASTYHSAYGSCNFMMSRVAGGSRQIIQNQARTQPPISRASKNAKDYGRKKKSVVQWHYNAGLPVRYLALAHVTRRQLRLQALQGL